MSEAAKRPECTCRERQHLEDELSKSRALVGQLEVCNERLHAEVGRQRARAERAEAQVAALRETLDLVRRMPMLDGWYPMLATEEGAQVKVRRAEWDLRMKEADAVLGDTAQAAAEHDQRVRRALMTELVEAQVTLQTIVDGCDFWPKGTAQNAVDRITKFLAASPPSMGNPQACGDASAKEHLGGLQAGSSPSAPPPEREP